MQRQCTASSMSIHTRSGYQWKGYPSTSLMSKWEFMILLDSTDEIIQGIAAKDTKLLAFFKLNQTDPRAHDLLYSDIPSDYCQIPGVASRNTPAQWRQRARNTTAVGRMYFVSSIAGERFFFEDALDPC